MGVWFQITARKDEVLAVISMPIEGNIREWVLLQNNVKYGPTKTSYNYILVQNAYVGILSGSS